MNKTISRKLLCGAISVALLFFACGDESGTDAKNNPVASEVDTRFELGKCTENQNGTVILVTTENAYYGCANGIWTKQGDETINSANQDAPILAISSSSYLLLPSSSSSSVRDTYSSSSSSKMKEAWSYLNPNISYGEFTDSRDGQIYKTVRIGNQVWMAENLNYNIDSLKSMCYNNSADSCFKYGRLYNWSVAKDACPKGWHLPTIDEWDTLVSYVGSGTAKITLKSASGWDKNGTNDFGFTALPAGNYQGGYHDDFYSVGSATTFWSAGEYEECSSAGYCIYTPTISNEIGFYRESIKYKELYLYSIRCIEGPSPIIEISSSSSFDPKMNNLNLKIDYGEFIDSRDGQYYKTVQIGNQVWMAENMNYEYGDNACYNDSSIYCAKYEKRYGRLYPYSTAKDICPKGWHLPDTSEWNTLFRYVKYPGPLLRSKKGWSDSIGFYDYQWGFRQCNRTSAPSDTLNALGPDALGFSWLPAGYYYVLSGGLYGDYPAFTQGQFESAGSSGCFWSKSTNYDIVCIREDSCSEYPFVWWDEWVYYLSKEKSNVYEAQSVRCLKD